MLDALDRALIAATQAGLPLTRDPYGDVAARLGATREDVLARLAAPCSTPARSAASALIPNHYALGVSANGMSVWDVDDEACRRNRRAVGALPFVTHCYRRPRHPPHWRYNLFAMAHGRDRDEVAPRSRKSPR
jgi:DNA-binding Lrp family transcriptional regulator